MVSVSSNFEKNRKELVVDDKFVMMHLGILSVWQWTEAIFSLFSQFYSKNPQSLLYLLIPEYNHDKLNHFIQLNHLPAESYILQEVPHSKIGEFIDFADAGLLLRKEHPVNFVSSPTKL